MADSRAIGFFDSGVGGLTVLREVMRRLPSESTVYIGDNARAPYGPRTDDEVKRFGRCLDEHRVARRPGDRRRCNPERVALRPAPALPTCRCWVGPAGSTAARPLATGASA
jgi:hypothetical protein